MVYFTLPEFYFNRKINNYIKLLNISHPEYFKIEMTISSSEGNFPYCYFNGGYNNNMGDGVLYDDILNFAQDNTLRLIFNCSNIFLEEKDFSNSLFNLILKLNENGSNSIAISDLTHLLPYLKNKYPNYNYIFSREAPLQNGFKVEDYEKILLEKDIKIVQIPDFMSLDLEFLKKLPNKNKIDLTINSCCDMLCPQYLLCKKQEHYNNISFSEKNNFKSCLKSPCCQNNPLLITCDMIENFYEPLGFKYFSFSSVISDKTDNFIIFFIENFIKDEFKHLVYRDIIENGELLYD